MFKIAHFATDQKFIETAVDIFEDAYPNQNEFYIISPKPWKFIKAKNIYTHLTLKELLILLIFNRKKIKEYDLVVLHGLSSIHLCMAVICKQKYVWLGWGYDYYERGNFGCLLSNPIYLPMTLQVMGSYINPKRYKFEVPGYFKKVLMYCINSKLLYRLAMRNMEVFSPVLPQEYKLVENRFGLGCRTAYYPWNYGVLEKHFIRGIVTDNIDTADAILLGNSATESNNHIDALELLEKLGVEKTIYLPLSYGNQKYADAVKEYIKTSPKMSVNCQVLDYFMPLDMYNETMNRCGFVIMNHVRQQALGNIVALLYRGAKVFLREESVLYYYLKSEGLVIFSIQELEHAPYLLDSHLDNCNIEKNRRILECSWSSSIARKKTIDLVTAVVESKNSYFEYNQ
ncbi:TPA: TDP-N-acetylfucosamine:lipid II N-acetylfucosaminyltransferase [Aeromonas salmonicida]|nr:TDP-N-acetylfucosamine:lipid II N-acetylfucosaminyltransferase [Aeromonas salmonicida]